MLLISGGSGTHSLGAVVLGGVLNWNNYRTPTMNYNYTTVSVCTSNKDTK